MAGWLETRLRNVLVDQTFKVSVDRTVPVHERNPESPAAPDWDLRAELARIDAVAGVVAQTALAVAAAGAAIIATATLKDSTAVLLAIGSLLTGAAAVTAFLALSRSPLDVADQAREAARNGHPLPPDFRDSLVGKAKLTKRALWTLVFSAEVFFGLAAIVSI